MFNFFVPIMKIKVQNLSTKAGSPRVCGREGQGQDLGEALREEAGSCPLCALRRREDSGAQGADEVVGIVVGEVPLDQPWSLPLINGRIP